MSAYLFAQNNMIVSVVTFLHFICSYLSVWLISILTVSCIFIDKLLLAIVGPKRCKIIVFVLGRRGDSLPPKQGTESGDGEETSATVIGKDAMLG